MSLAVEVADVVTLVVEVAEVGNVVTLVVEVGDMVTLIGEVGEVLTLIVEVAVVGVSNELCEAPLYVGCNYLRTLVCEYLPLYSLVTP